MLESTSRQGLRAISHVTREALARCELFTGLTSMQFQKAAALVEEYRLQPEEMLLREGEPARHLFVVVRGKAVAQLTRDKGCVTLGSITTGEVAGWSSLIYAQEYPASVKALTAMRVARIETSGLLMLMNLEPEIGFPIQKRLSSIFFRQYQAAMAALKTVE